MFLHLYVILFTGEEGGLPNPPAPGVGQTLQGWADPSGCRPPQGWADPPRYGQQAGGTHPTGMHTCV